MTNIYQINAKNITKASEVIKAGGLVAMPTETVYGLGANVYNAKAVASIFAAKERPNFNPLISHIADIDFLPQYAHVDSRVIELGKRFWPGPLTMVLNRKDFSAGVDLACAGLPTTTVRIPNHPVALELIKQSGVPIVAPSANKSTTISPTSAEHVWESLGSNVDMILDGGVSKVGVESTIIDLTGKDIYLLRAGGIAIEDIESFLGEKILISSASSNAPKAPGQMLKHYAPSHNLRINAKEALKGEFFIGFGSVQGDLNLSENACLKEAASNLFAFLRLADKNPNISSIAVAPIPESGLGMAINDRLKRAQHK